LQPQKDTIQWQSYYWRITILKDSDGRAALSYTVEQGYESVIKLLLAQTQRTSE
jgi:hypothetical protein